jgi:hypothetical protein
VDQLFAIMVADAIGHRIGLTVLHGVHQCAASEHFRAGLIQPAGRHVDCTHHHFHIC